MSSFAADAAPVPPPKPAKPTNLPAAAAPDATADTSGELSPASSAARSVAEILTADADDESLRKYKASLLGTAAQGDLGDVSDPRRVVITEFRVMFEPGEGREDLVSGG
jgi:hypothetical protein